MFYKYGKNEKIPGTKFIACFFFELVSTKCCIKIKGMKIILGQNLSLVSFCYESENCFISIIEMKIFLEQNLLLGPLCYEIENVCISIIRMKIFLRQKLLLVSYRFC